MENAKKIAQIKDNLSQKAAKDPLNVQRILCLFAVRELDLNGDADGIFSIHPIGVQPQNTVLDAQRRARIFRAGDTQEVGQFA